MLRSLRRVKQTTKRSKLHFAQRFGAAFDDFMQLDLPGTRNGLDDNVRNLDKFLLYNDPFMGMMDQTVLSGEGAQFGTCAERLETLQTLPEWGYLFETLGALCPGAGGQGGTRHPRPRGIPHRR